MPTPDKLKHFMSNAELAIEIPTQPEADSGSGSMPAQTILSAVDNDGAEEGGKRIAQPGPTDSELVRLAKEGNEKAFRELVERHRDKAHRLVMRFIHNDTDVEDVVQEAFISVFRSIGGFEELAEFSSWLYRIVSNAALMRLRYKGRKSRNMDSVSLGEYDIADVSPGVSPLARLERRELDEQISSAVDLLRPILRDVLIMRDVEGMSTNDTAEIMGLSVPTVKARLFRARRQLQEALNGYLEDDLTV
jgi:RNA polymerase sigma-70 factor, ECF subfamily